MSVTLATKTGDIRIDALLGDNRWASGNLTYSFPALASSYGTSYPNGEPDNNFGSLNLSQQQAARAALATYAAVANVTFTELSGANASNATLRMAQSDMGDTAWAYLPNKYPSGGDVWLNNSSGAYDAPKPGNYAYHTFLHEIGHALGLEHPHENRMPTQFDAMPFTVMSYHSFSGSAQGYYNETWGFAQSLMMQDIAAVQHLYGANFSHQSGSTTYSWNPTTGQMSINGTAQAMPGANRVFQTVWDGGGNDTYDLSNYASDVSIDLRPGAWSITSQAQVAKLHGNGSELAPGNVANAHLYQGDTRSLIENAVGGSKNDIVIGNDVGNLLRGENGYDRLFGEGGDDFILGGKGIDQIDGGLGTDTTAVSGFSGGGHELFRYGNSVYALDGTDRSHDIVSNVELFNDGASSIALAAVDAFNPLSYSASYNDLAQWLRGDAQGSLNHYLYHGFFEGREAAYDAAQYLANYADLRAAFGANLELATSHFLASGVDEHRLAENPLEYIASYDDLMDAFDFTPLQQTIDQGRNHYQASGFSEGRRGGIDFDADQYMENFSDLAAAFNGDDTFATFHYINTGRHEHRLAEDPLLYLASSDDLLQAFGGPGTSLDELKNWGTRHFEASGWQEGRPTDFDTDQYLGNYVDLRRAFSDGQGGYNEDAALLHYINYGFYEGRTDDLFV